MNKKERAAFDAAIARAETLAALRWTEPVEPDLPAPTYGAHTEGWLFNAHSSRVWRAWSESVSHGDGPYPSGKKTYRSGSQGCVALYSTEVLAQRGLRHALERQAAERLRAIDMRLADLAAQQEQRHE